MFQRRVSVDDVVRVLRSGEDVQVSPDNKPYPTRVVLGWSDRRPLHVVIADNLDQNETIVITVYEPDCEYWDSSFRRRR